MDMTFPSSRDVVSSQHTGEYEVVSEDSMRSSQDLINYFVDQEPIQTDLERGVAYLQKVGESGTSAYEHLRQIIKKILETRPENVIDFFEEFSRQIRTDNYYQRHESFIEPWISNRSLQYAQLQLSNINLFVTKEEVGTDPEEAFKGSEDGDVSTEEKKDYEELLNHLLPHVGLGFPKKNTLAFIFAMKKLEKNVALEDVRFWGKIYGLEKNYFIAEATLTAEERERRQLETEGENEDTGADDFEAPPPFGELADSATTLRLPDAMEEEQDEAHFAYTMPPLPVAKVKKPVEIKPEDPGTGVNKKTFFVCHELGEDWRELPDVTPAQIIAARQFPSYLTGNLDATITSFPSFPGKEINYLRVQVARISASCHISPQGLYMLSEEEDVDEDENQVRTAYVLDDEFEGQSLMNLLETNMDYWCHHTNEILVQGRVNWWDPKSADEGGEEEEEEEAEEEEKAEAEEPEVGKQLLTSVAEDTFDELVPSWNVKCSSVIDQGRAYAIASSNTWPGAYAFARDRKFENIYFGWGQKSQLRGFTPVPLPPTQDQFPFDLIEEYDPTPQQEEDYRLSLIKSVDEEGGEENEEEAEEEEEED